MDGTQAQWPIAELARRVAAALAVGYDGPGDNRVRGVPDVRSIRWYATIGLLDKPAAFRGRTALYGPRHLRQVVAVKRRQAAGKALAEIQAELAGASDAKLSEVAGVPDAIMDGAASPTAAAEVDTNFWKTPAVRLERPVSSTLSYGIRLPGGVTVLVEAPHAPTEADVEAVEAAAQPLLRALEARGLSNQGAST
jgi:DNA-binding transcriptional MerR regulator